MVTALPGQRGTVAARRHRLQPRQSATTAGLTLRHPELVADEPSATAVQDGWPADPTCPVLHSAACRKLLDWASLPADRCAHRATRVASDVIGRTAQAGEPDRRRPGCRHEGRPTLERGGIRVLAPRKRAVSPSASGQHGSEGVTSPARQGEMWEKMGPDRQSWLKAKSVSATV